MHTYTVLGQTYTLSEAQQRALLIIDQRRREGKRTSAGDVVKSRTLTSLAAMGLVSARGNVYAVNYTTTTRGMTVARLAGGGK